MERPSVRSKVPAGWSAALRWQFRKWDALLPDRRDGRRNVRSSIPSETGDAGTVDLTVRRGGLEAV
jgi:hypothetical protein